MHNQNSISLYKRKLKNLVVSDNMIIHIIIFNSDTFSDNIVIQIENF